MGKLAVFRDAKTLGLWQQIQAAPFVGLVALEADQLAKLCVRGCLSPEESIPDGSRLRITYVVNPGILFGRPASPIVSLLAPLAMILGAMVVYWKFHRSGSMLLNVGAGLFIGGTLGNLIDRILWGQVTDFIEVISSGGDVTTVFNLADLFIIAGILMLEVFLIGLIIRVIREKGLRYNPVKSAIAKAIRRRDHDDD